MATTKTTTDPWLAIWLPIILLGAAVAAVAIAGGMLLLTYAASCVLFPNGATGPCLALLVPIARWRTVKLGAEYEAIDDDGCYLATVYRRSDGDWSIADDGGSWGDGVYEEGGRPLTFPTMQAAMAHVDADQEEYGPPCPSAYVAPVVFGG